MRNQDTVLWIQKPVTWAKKPRVDSLRNPPCIRSQMSSPCRWDDWRLEAPKLSGDLSTCKAAGHASDDPAIEIEIGLACFSHKYLGMCFSGPRSTRFLFSWCVSPQSWEILPSWPTNLHNTLENTGNTMQGAKNLMEISPPFPSPLACRALKS
jgi:hypothetical protein